MTDKLTPKQEAFCLSYMETSNQSEAYRSAYDVGENTKPQTIWADACRVMAKPLVAARVFELQQAAKERTLVTVESITKELDENRLKANDLDQVAPMNVATVAKAKIHGVMVDKVDHTSSDKSMTPVSDDANARAIAFLLQKAAKDK